MTFLIILLSIVGLITICILVSRIKTYRWKRLTAYTNPTLFLSYLINDNGLWKVHFRERMHFDKITLKFPSGDLSIWYDCSGSVTSNSYRKDMIKSIANNEVALSATPFINVFTSPESAILQLATLITNIFQPEILRDRKMTGSLDANSYDAFSILDFICQNLTEYHLYIYPVGGSVEIYLSGINSYVYLKNITTENTSTSINLKDNKIKKATQIDNIAKLLFDSIKVRKRLKPGSTIYCGKHFVVCPDDNISYRHWSPRHGFMDICSIDATIESFLDYGVVVSFKYPVDIFQWNNKCVIPYAAINLNTLSCNSLIKKEVDSHNLSRGSLIEDNKWAIKHFKKDGILVFSGEQEKLIPYDALSW